MAETRRDCVTLAALLAVLQERDRVFIAHRMGPHECEGVAGGTVRELRSTHCVEVCGDSVVERLALDLDQWPEIWPDEAAPVLVIEGVETVNKTKIEWCDKTLNPVVGCSYGCPYCYARRINTRFHYVSDFSEPQFFPDRLEQLKSKTPAKVFLTSMSDPADWRREWADAVIEAIESNPQHEYLLLSKRPEEYADIFPLWRHIYGDLKNIWYGATVTSYRDLHKIADLPLYGKRFISFELLLGSADPRLRPVKAAVPWIDWAIIGAETGPGASARRPRREWVEEIVSYCDETGVPVFMKDSLLPVVGAEGMRRDFPNPLIWI